MIPPIHFRAEGGCMGGWCKSRENCANYVTEDKEPRERLCAPGEDGVLEGGPRIVWRAAGTWERKPGTAALLKPACPMEIAA